MRSGSARATENVFAMKARRAPRRVGALQALALMMTREGSSEMSATTRYRVRERLFRRDQAAGPVVAIALDNRPL